MSLDSVGHSPRSAGWWLILLITAACAACLLGPAPRAGAASLADGIWSTSKTGTGATGTSYTYSFTAATTSPLTSVTMTVPAGTGGTPAVGTVSPPSLAGGSIAFAGTTLTYAFPSATVTARTAISIQVTGLTNTATAGSYTSTLTTLNGTTTVDTGTTSAVTLTSGVLTNPAWTSSSAAIGATGVSYTYTFTTATLALITSVTMTVPPGTAGTPTLGAVSPAALLGGSLTLSGTTLTYTGISVTLLAGTSVSIQVNGLTNTSAAGSYTSEIVTHSATGPVDSGITPAVALTGPLILSSPGSLTWAATLTGRAQSTADPAAADQQLTVDDETATGAGWHITAAATTFTSGTHTLPSTGTLVFTGGTSSVTASTAPSWSCGTSCTPPADATAYPVSITTASSSPPAATVYDTPAGTGLHAVTLGGSTATNPIGWWISIPASAYAGTYTTTVTLSIVSGP